MGSVVVSWKGTCRAGGLRDELLAHLETLARAHASRLGGPSPPRPPVSEALQRSREEGSPALPDLLTYDREIEGRILVLADVAGDEPTLLADAARQGVEVMPSDCGILLRPGRLGVRGIDFRLFDPRGLYPGEDRMSFIFLASEAPCLDGRVVAVRDLGWCSRSDSAAIRDAEWFLEGPSVHLRYYLEEWSDCLFAWIKTFFMPDLSYWRYEPLSNYEVLRASFDEWGAGRGESGAKEVAFGALLDTFEASADEWIEKMKSW